VCGFRAIYFTGFVLHGPGMSNRNRSSPVFTTAGFTLHGLPFSQCDDTGYARPRKTRVGTEMLRQERQYETRFKGIDVPCQTAVGPASWSWTGRH